MEAFHEGGLQQELQLGLEPPTLPLLPATGGFKVSPVTSNRFN
jgi:hypothetical protein